MLTRISIALSSLLCSATVLVAHAEAEGWSYAPTDARNPAAPTPVVLVLSQRTLVGGEDPGVEGPPNLLLNGVLGEVFYDGMNRARNASRNHRAVERVSPLVPALDGFDANAVLRTRLAQALAQVAWLRLVGVTQPSDGAGSVAGLPPEVRTAPYFGVVFCEYVLSGDLDRVYAYCENTIYQNRSAQAENSGGSDGGVKLVHHRRTEVQVGLARYDADAEGRKAQWTANSAAPLKRALTTALSAVAQMSVNALAQGPSDYDAYLKARKLNLGEYIDGHGGELIDGGENLTNDHESCFNRKNNSSVKVDSAGVLLEEEDGGTYRCMGVSPP